MKHVLQSGFHGASLKVERAYRHIDELQGLLERLNNLGPDAVTRSPQPDGPDLILIASDGVAGNHLPLALGDTVHNLRAAFDHIWMALWRASGKTSFGYFPFHETRENCKDAVAKSPVKVAFPDVERLILDDVKPYGDADGNRALWAITKLDKIDKHNLIIPVVKTNRIENLRLGGVTLINCQSSNNYALALVPEGSEYEQKGEITLEITFPQDNLLRGQPVIPTILNMAEATAETVKLFKETFL